MRTIDGLVIYALGVPGAMHASLNVRLILCSLEKRRELRTIWHLRFCLATSLFHLLYESLLLRSSEIQRLYRTKISTMSGLEVVGIVASLVSAFHGGAELVKLYKKRRAKKREKRQQHERELHEAEAQDQVVQDILHTSLEEGGTVVSRQFLDEQRALGQYSQMLRSGDDRAKQELLMIAVSLQAEVIASLGRAQENLQVIVDMVQLKTLHEVTITKRYEATRSISELRQRIEMTLPLPRLSADSALGISISRRNSNESLARTFVTAAANLCISEPTAQRLLTVPPIPGRQQSQLRRPGPSTRTLSSFQYLIPEIRAQDIDILTLAGYDMGHENESNIVTSPIANLPQLRVPISNISSQSQLTPDSDPLAQPFERVGPYFLPRTLSEDTGWPKPGHFTPLEVIESHSTLSNAPEIVRAVSAPTNPFCAAAFPEPDADITSRLRPDDHRPYCAGAIAAQKDFGASFTRQQLPILPGSQKLSPSWKCSACDFNASDSDGKLLQRIEFAHGVRYRFPFCARSHAAYTHPPDAFRPRYTYGCQFCTAEGRTSATHVGSGALMAHIATKHRTNLTPEVRTRTHSVVGRLAPRDEGWDVNLPDVSSKSGSGMGRWMLHAVTSLPT
jgi:hypothetical protein